MKPVATMSDPFKEFSADLDALLVRHGIETYLIVCKSPFNDDVATRFGGSSAWTAGQAMFHVDLMNKRWNEGR